MRVLPFLLLAACQNAAHGPELAGDVSPTALAMDPENCATYTVQARATDSDSSALKLRLVAHEPQDRWFYEAAHVGDAWQIQIPLQLKELGLSADSGVRTVSLLVTDGEWVHEGHEGPPDAVQGGSLEQLTWAFDFEADAACPK